MAKNYVEDGHTIDYTATAAISSGDVVVVGALVGISLSDLAVDETGALRMDGVWQVPKTAAGALDQGALVDFDVSAGEFAALGTPATGDIVGAGVVWNAAADGDTTVWVKINAGKGAVAA